MHKEHAEEYLVFAKNIGTRLCIDETSLSNGELYTIVTNPDKKKHKGCLVAILKGTKSEDIINVLNYIPHPIRCKVKEVNVDMAANMHYAIAKSFPRAEVVVDRFHVQKLAQEALQDIRISYRWDAIDQESKAIKQAKKNDESYNPISFSNGDTSRQLLARSRYLLFRSREKWSNSQKLRATILFYNYPEIENAYNIVHRLRCILNQQYDKNTARLSLAKWFNQVDAYLWEKEPGKNPFASVLNSFEVYSDKILNYFNNRSTNAFAESFNAKVKRFRANFRGVTDIKFFLFRLSKIYA